ncbi:47_t:CDS:2 [Entrophospora sp. SA101]|nr:47_t:CDS:2 [Entrophospora sp. SA101]
MLSCITQTFNYIVKALANIDDNKDPFEAGDLVEVREEIEYVETPKLTTQKLKLFHLGSMLKIRPLLPGVLGSGGSGVGTILSRLVASDSKISPKSYIF